MLSAFGVEHSEVSKAIKLPGMPKMPKPGLLKPIGQSIAGGTTRLGQRAGAMGGSQLRQGNEMRGGLLGSAGNRMRSAGGAMAARPGLTGGMAVGGAAAGVGAVGYGTGRSRNRRGNGQIR